MISEKGYDWLFLIMKQACPVFKTSHLEIIQRNDQIQRTRASSNKTQNCQWQPVNVRIRHCIINSSVLSKNANDVKSIYILKVFTPRDTNFAYKTFRMSNENFCFSQQKHLITELIIEWRFTFQKLQLNWVFWLLRQKL